MKEHYGRSVRDHLGHYPVWAPGSGAEVGDYGLIQGRCFFRLGSITEKYQVPFTTSKQARQFFQFESAGTSVIESQLEANTNGAAAQLADADASLTLKFTSAHSLYIKAADSWIETMDEPFDVATMLQNHPEWNFSFKVVTAVQKVPRLLLLMNNTANSSITLRGRAELVQAAKLGKIDANAQVAVSGDAGLKIVGASGTFWVDLMKIRRFFGPALEATGGALKPKPAEVVSASAEVPDDPAPSEEGA